MEIKEINEEQLKDAREISRNYERVVEVRQELFELTNKVKEQNQITPNDFVELISEIMNLTYVIADLEIENVIERNHKKKILKEIKETQNERKIKTGQQ